MTMKMHRALAFSIITALLRTALAENQQQMLPTAHIFELATSKSASWVCEGSKLDRRKHVRLAQGASEQTPRTLE